MSNQLILKIILAIFFIAVSVLAVLNGDSSIDEEIPNCSEELTEVYYEICGLEEDFHVQKMLTESIKKEIDEVENVKK